MGQGCGGENGFPVVIIVMGSGWCKSFLVIWWWGKGGAKAGKMEDQWTGDYLIGAVRVG